MTVRVCLHPSCHRRLVSGPGVDGCGVACRAHWFQLPADLRRELAAASVEGGQRLRFAVTTAKELWELAPPTDPRRKLITQERSGTVHAVNGAAIRTRGRWVAETLCGPLVAGRVADGRLSTLTCPACKQKAR